MPELSHDTADDGFHEIQLSGKQLVFLFIVTTSVVVGVFLFGVLVGRGARDARPETPGATTSTTPAAGELPSSEPASREAPPVVPDEPNLSAPATLTGRGDAADTLKSAPADSKPVPPATVPPRESAAAREPAPAPREPAPAPREPAAAPRPAPAAVPSSGTPGVWLVQVIATRDQEVATSVAKRLGAKGYPAFLISPVPGAQQPYYKVQIGRYKDRGEAEQVSQRIKKEEQFQSWILR